MANLVCRTKRYTRVHTSTPTKLNLHGGGEMRLLCLGGGCGDKTSPLKLIRCFVIKIPGRIVPRIEMTSSLANILNNDGVPISQRFIVDRECI
jgi:hypothetical protein